MIAELLSNTDAIVFSWLIFCRVSGFMFISPLFSNQSIPQMAKLMLVLALTLMITVVVYPDYFGTAATHPYNLSKSSGFGWAAIGIASAQEMAIGVLIGLCFSLIFESVLLAGQLISVMIGFSMAEMLNPITNRQETLVSQFYTMFASLLLLAFDAHHVFVRSLSSSFTTVPVGFFELRPSLMSDLTLGTSRVFEHGMQIAAIPFVVLFLMTVVFGLMARVMPEMNIFVVGMPIRILAGYFCLFAAITYFPQLLQAMVIEFNNLGDLVLRQIGPG